MTFEMLRKPMQFLRHILPDLPSQSVLEEYQTWWEREGNQISEDTDRAGTPALRQFDRYGNRVDEVLYFAERLNALRRGYRTGVVWRAFEEHSILSCCLLDYLTCFYDPGLTCPHVVSLATAIALDKHGTEELKSRYLAPLLRKGDDVWQGATWMTELKGGSDLGAGVETTARSAGDHWLLNGDKYFASNAGAELALVAARPAGAAAGVRGVALFLLPRRRANGNLNYAIRRLKQKVGTRSVPTGEVELRDSEAYLLGQSGSGIHLILEVLNLSRATNSLGSVAIAQRAMAEALAFAEQRIAFGKPILEHPLLYKQFTERLAALEAAMALAWESVRCLEEVWRETPPYSDRYHHFRLVAHLAKYWTSELAPQIARWTMEVYGGLGVLDEFPAERWFREAMVLTIWEGTSHRQILDGLEVMERKNAHRMLFERLTPGADPKALKQMIVRVDTHLALPVAEREARAEELFSDLARFSAQALRSALQAPTTAGVS